LLHRHALRVIAVQEHGDRVQVFARGDVAQRESLAHHVGQLGVERVHVLDELVAQAALEQGGAQRGVLTPMNLVLVSGFNAMGLFDEVVYASRQGHTQALRALADGLPTERRHS
jgi:hypothetical protein